jgi:hypothetical protein
VTKVAANGAAGPVAVEMPVAVVAVAAPAGQVLQGGPGDLPVAATARGVAPGLGAQQPTPIGPVPLTGHGRPPPEVASAITVLATAAALPPLTGPAGPLAGGGRGHWSRPPDPGHPAPNMLGRPGVVQA